MLVVFCLQICFGGEEQFLSSHINRAQGAGYFIQGVTQHVIQDVNQTFNILGVILEVKFKGITNQIHICQADFPPFLF